MVKQSTNVVTEKKVKRNPMLPIYGLIIAVGLALLAFILAEPVIKGIPQFGELKAQMDQGKIAVRFLVAGAMWFLMLAVAFFVVSILVGPNTEDKKNKMPLPPRTIKKKKY